MAKVKKPTKSSKAKKTDDKLKKKKLKSKEVKAEKKTSKVKTEKVKDKKVKKAEKPAADKKAKNKKTKVAKADKKVKKTKKKNLIDVSGITPVKEQLNKSALIQHIIDESESAELTPKQVKHVLAVIENTIKGSLIRKGSGVFQWPGLFKIQANKIAAKKGGQKKPNPFKPGETYITKDKPATVKVKIRPLKAIKDAALSSLQK